jgi:hypothetical protein
MSSEEFEENGTVDPWAFTQSPEKILEVAKACENSFTYLEMILTSIGLYNPSITTTPQYIALDSTVKMGKSISGLMAKSPDNINEINAGAAITASTLPALKAMAPVGSFMQSAVSGAEMAVKTREAFSKGRKALKKPAFNSGANALFATAGMVGSTKPFITNKSTQKVVNMVGKTGKSASHVKKLVTAKKIVKNRF